MDFGRAMNRITFDKIVDGNNKTFSYVTVPEKIIEPIPERGKLWLSF